MNKISLRLTKKVESQMRRKYEAVKKTESFKKHRVILISDNTFNSWLNDLSIATGSDGEYNGTPQ